MRRFDKKKEAAIRALALEKMSSTEMARVLGICPATVRRYLEWFDIPHVGNVWSSRSFNTHPLIGSLRKERMSRGLSLRKFSKRVGYCPSMVGEWERGARRISLDALVNFAQALGFELVLASAEEKRQ